MDILGALSFLHQHRIAHRDIKSDNVLVRYSGLQSPKNLYLSDFGTAKAFDETNRALKTTTVVGTMSYMPPEMMPGNSYDPFMSDVWSFGVLLQEMLTGDLPTKRNAEEVLQGKIPEISPGTEITFPKFVATVRSCTKLDPEERPTASKLLETMKNMH